MFQSFNKNAGVWSCLQSLTSQGLVELSALNLAAWRYPTTAIHPPGIVGPASEQVEKYTEIEILVSKTCVIFVSLLLGLLTRAT